MKSLKELQGYLLLEFPVKLKKLNLDSPRQFGEMNVLQMLDHLRKAFVLSHSRFDIDIVSPAEDLPKLQAFLASDKPIRPGAQMPQAYHLVDALDEDLQDMKLQCLKEMVAMLADFEKNPDFQQNHPIFGQLNIQQWLQLHKKHSEHHLRQFGID